MKLLSALVLSVLVCGLAQAQEPKDKCGCAKPKPTQPAQVAKPAAAPHKSAAAPACPAPEQKNCPSKPHA